MSLPPRPTSSHCRTQACPSPAQISDPTCANAQTQRIGRRDPAYPAEVIPSTWPEALRSWQKSAPSSEPCRLRGRTFRSRRWAKRPSLGWPSKTHEAVVEGRWRWAPASRTRSIRLNSTSPCCQGACLAKRKEKGVDKNGRDDDHDYGEKGNANHVIKVLITNRAVQIPHAGGRTPSAGSARLR